MAAVIEDMVYLSFDGVDTKRMSGSSMTQVCRTMPSDSDREIANLRAIRDDYPKMVVTMDRYGSDNLDGIRIIPLDKFLQSR